MVYFLKLHMDMYLRAKFEVPSKILTGFRQGGGGGGNFTPTPSSPQNKHLKSPPRLGLNISSISSETC